MRHYQPHLLSDLVFYDLRLPEAKAAQAALASQYGINGFCYYHYWFKGRRILERPFQEVFESGNPSSHSVFVGPTKIGLNAGMDQRMKYCFIKSITRKTTSRTSTS